MLQSLDENKNLIYNNFDERFKIDGKLIYNKKISDSSFGSYIINNT